MSYNGEGLDFEIKSKRKGEKKGKNVPLNQLGFKAKVYYDCVEGKPRKTFGRFRKTYHNKTYSKENYLARLTFILDASQCTAQQAKEFKGAKKVEWDKIMQVIVRSKERIECCICLAEQIAAPQITKCGHIFCWHCLLMHQEKSLRANNCPVCNEFIDNKDAKSCKPIFELPLCEQESIHFEMRLRKLSNNNVFNPATQQQDLRFCRVIRMRRNGIMKLFEEQNDHLLAFSKENKYPDLTDYLAKAYSMSDHRIQKYRNSTASQIVNLTPGQFINGQCICQAFDQYAPSMNFYQQEKGRSIYLHPISQKFITKCIKKQNLPQKFETKIVLKQFYECTVQNLRKNKSLGHLPVNSQVDIVLVELGQLVDDEKALAEYNKQVNIYKKQREKQQEVERIESQRLSLIYQEQRKYIRKLHQMAQKQFYDINVPTYMDPSQMNEETFPSLHSNSESRNADSDKEKDSKLQVPVLSLTASSPNSRKQSCKTNQPDKIWDDDDFPDLTSNKLTKPSKSETQQGQQGGRKKKRKKQKFIDVTAQFFNREQEDDF